MDVTAVVTYENPPNDHAWWLATVADEDGGGTTNARRLDRLCDAVAEMVILRHNLPDDAQVTVELDLSGVPGLAEALAEVRDAEAEADAATRHVKETRRALADATRHLTVRDLAVVLGVSNETAAKLRRDVA